MPEDITVIMPTQKQAQKENNFHPLKPFDKEQFQYDSDKDEYICPEGKRLKYVGAAFSSTRKELTKQRVKTAVGVLIFAFVLPPETEEGLSAWRKNRSKNALKIFYHSPQGQEVYRLRKQKVESPLAT